MDILKEGVSNLTKSRSSSKDSRKSESESTSPENVPQPHNDPPPINNINTANSVASKHPLGKLLLTCIKDPTNKDVDQFCKNFEDYLKISDQGQNDKKESLKEELKKDFSSTLYSNHLLTSDKCEVEIPTFQFDTPSQMDKEKKQNLLRYLLPHDKFSGTGKPHILEFLDNLTHAQKVLKLSEEDFKYEMTRCTSGPVYAHLRASFANGSSVRENYLYLLNCFHRPMSADTAMKMLSNFKADKSMNLARLQSKINMLATTASKIIPIATRQSFINSYASTFLIQSLPHASST